MKKKILIISGGISKEREISLQTGNQVAKELKDNKYSVKICEPNHNLFKVIKKFKPNTIFNALHGQYGEDGYIQSILESLKIKYTHSGVLSSALAMDKVTSKEIFKKKFSEIMNFKIYNDIKSINILNLNRLDIYLKNNTNIKLGDYDINLQMITLTKVMQKYKNFA